MIKRTMSSRVLLICVVSLVGVGIAIGTAATGSSAASATAPSNTSPPTISGTATVGHTLTATRGTWTGTEPITYAYRWLRCDQDGGSCSGISGATGTTYLLKSVDVDNSLRVRVTATNASGSDTQESVPTAIVKAANVPSPTGCPSTSGTLAVAAVSPPARLSIDETQVEPSTVTFRTRAITVRFHVSACGGQPVQGAVVYATAVPYGQFAIPNEQPTGSDGWASLDFEAQPGFPVSSKQAILVTFVRARKPGDSVLGGISTRRLVSFRITH